MGRWTAWVSMVLLASGCGLVLDLDPPDVDAGGMDAGGIDAGPGDSGPRDAGVECTRPDDCFAIDPCTSFTCEGGECVAGFTNPCEDNYECTSERCVGNGRCEITASEGPCLMGVPDAECTGFRCRVGQGCVRTELRGECNDGFACTRDVCDVEGGGSCLHFPIDEMCRAGERCAEESGCEPVTCSIDEDCSGPCASGQCIDEVCVVTNRDDGTLCDIADLCSEAGQCLDGACLAEPVVCADDLNPCTLDFCDPDIGCVNLPDPGAEGRLCNPPGCAIGECNEFGFCEKVADTCLPDPEACVLRDCVASECQERTPCARQNRICVGSASGDDLCGDCLMDFEDCDDNGTCEHDRADGPCPSDDAGIPAVDAGIPPVDAGMPPVDAGAGCPPGALPQSSDDVCPMGTADCDEDECCECMPGSTCSVLPPLGVCLPVECVTSAECPGVGAPSCCCGLCVPGGTTCSSVCISDAM